MPLTACCLTTAARHDGLVGQGGTFAFVGKTACTVSILS